MKHFDNLFPPAVQLYSYLHDIAFEYPKSNLAITKLVSFTLHHSDLLTVDCEQGGRFSNVQLNPALLKSYLKILKSTGFITYYKSIKNDTFEVVLRRTPNVKRA